MSLSTGFIWACGGECVSDPVVWTTSRHEFLVFVAAFVAWWGYLFAHYAWTGSFIDDSIHDDEQQGHDHGRIENPWIRRLSVASGAGILVLGMVIGILFIRQGNHLMTNLGGILFLGGYVIAHYAETGNPV